MLLSINLQKAARNMLQHASHLDVVQEDNRYYVLLIVSEL